VLLATDRADPTTLYEAVLTAPEDSRRLNDPAWREHSRCFALMEALRARVGGPAPSPVTDTLRYWCETFPRYSVLTRELLLTYFKATWQVPAAAAEGPTSSAGGEVA
jgi:hypothetical protein